VSVNVDIGSVGYDTRQAILGIALVAARTAELPTVPFWYPPHIDTEVQLPASAQAGGVPDQNAEGRSKTKEKPAVAPPAEPTTFLLPTRSLCDMILEEAGDRWDQRMSIMIDETDKFSNPDFRHKMPNRLFEFCPQALRKDLSRRSGIDRWHCKVEAGVAVDDSSEPEMASQGSQPAAAQADTGMGRMTSDGASEADAPAEEVQVELMGGTQSIKEAGTKGALKSFTVVILLNSLVARPADPATVHIAKLARAMARKLIEMEEEAVEGSSLGYVSAEIGKMMANQAMVAAGVDFGFSQLARNLFNIFNELKRGEVSKDSVLARLSGTPTNTTERCTIRWPGWRIHSWKKQEAVSDEAVAWAPVQAWLFNVFDATVGAMNLCQRSMQELTEAEKLLSAKFTLHGGKTTHGKLVRANCGRFVVLAVPMYMESDDYERNNFQFAFAILVKPEHEEERHTRLVEAMALSLKTYLEEGSGPTSRTLSQIAKLGRRKGNEAALQWLTGLLEIVFQQTVSSPHVGVIVDVAHMVTAQATPLLSSMLFPPLTSTTYQLSMPFRVAGVSSMTSWCAEAMSLDITAIHVLRLCDGKTTVKDICFTLGLDPEEGVEVIGFLHMQGLIGLSSSIASDQMRLRLLPGKDEGDLDGRHFRCHQDFDKLFGGSRLQASLYRCLCSAPSGDDASLPEQPHDFIPEIEKLYKLLGSKSVAFGHGESYGDFCKKHRDTLLRYGVDKEAFIHFGVATGLIVEKEDVAALGDAFGVGAFKEGSTAFSRGIS